MLGMFALIWLATYASEKSRVSSAVQSPIAASSVNANAAYDARSPLRTRSARLPKPPAKDTVAHQAAINSAIQSDSSPTTITRRSRARRRGGLVPRSVAVFLRRVLVARRALREQRRGVERSVLSHASFHHD